MFEQLTEEYIDLKKLNLVSVHHSLNQPQISPGPGLGVQQAEAYTLVFQTLTRQMLICVGLYFPQANKRVIYRHGPFATDQLESELAETEMFTNQMGFLMRNLNFGSAGVSERSDIIRTIPFFYADMDLYYQSLSISEIEVKRSSSESGVRKGAEADLQQKFVENYLTVLAML